MYIDQKVDNIIMRIDGDNVNSKEKEILLALNKFDRSAISLIEQFGPETRIILDSFEKEGTVTIDTAPTYNVRPTLIKLSPKGKSFLDEDFCSACECSPCDCGWGSDE